MIIVSDECEAKNYEITGFLPLRLRRFLDFFEKQDIEEVRLRTGRPLVVKLRAETFFVTHSGKPSKKMQNTVTVTAADIESAVELLCGSSVYAYEDEIKNGYITVRGGHRVGICGTAVIDGGEITFINNISGLNYRFAHEIQGAANAVIDDVYNDGNVRNTLIISPPGMGKTTMLRDIARQLSNRGQAVSIVDERSELTSMHNGVPGFDIGIFTDVLNGCSKADGMRIMLRSMSPSVIVTDEIGTHEDFEAVRKAAGSGVSVITTVHGKSINDLCGARLGNIQEQFNCIITLSDRKGPGTVEGIMTR